MILKSTLEWAHSNKGHWPIYVDKIPQKKKKDTTKHNFRFVIHVNEKQFGSSYLTTWYSHWSKVSMPELNL